MATGAGVGRGVLLADGGALALDDGAGLAGADAPGEALPTGDPEGTGEALPESDGAGLLPSGDPEAAGSPDGAVDGSPDPEGDADGSADPLGAVDSLGEGLGDGDALGAGDAAGSIAKPALVRSTPLHPNPVGSPLFTQASTVVRLATRSQSVSVGVRPSVAMGAIATARNAAPLPGQIVLVVACVPVVPLIRPNASTVNLRAARASDESSRPEASTTAR